jgi:hypothetical protein
MNQRTSHKELVLMLGIVVALLVILLLWFSQVPGAQSADLLPQVISPLKDGFIKKTMIELSRVLLGG